jgi:hypothetical protein
MTIRPKGSIEYAVTSEETIPRVKDEWLSVATLIHSDIQVFDLKSWHWSSHHC